MKRVLTAVVLIPLVLLAVFRAPDWFFAGLVGCVAILALTEYLQIIAAYQYTTFRLTTYVVTALIYAGLLLFLFGQTMTSVLTFLVISVVVLIVAPSVYLLVGMTEPDLRKVLPGAAMSFFGVPYVGLSLATLGFMRNMSEGWFPVLFTFLCVWVGDTAAYYVGRSMGRHKFAARVSPKKTWEGAIASVLGAVIVAVLFTYAAPHIQQWLYAHGVLPAAGGDYAVLTRPRLAIIVVFAFLINVAAQLGDLFESLIKRGAGVKDSGTMLPGHGGILDRIDALLFASPVAAILFGWAGDKFLSFL